MAKDARSRDCSVPENGYLLCAKDARPRYGSVPENPGVNSSALGMPGLDCSVQWILGVC